MEDSLEILEENNNTPPIKYLLIGNIDSNKIITEYSSTGEANEIKSEINQIFKKICKTQTKKFEERNKITSKDSIYYYIVEKPNIFFIILVDEEYSEDFVFELIDKIKEKELIKVVNNETNKIKLDNENEINNLINYYQKKTINQNGNENENDNTTININGKDNIFEKENEKTFNEDVEDLQTKTDEFFLTNNKNKWDIKNLKIWKNYRTWLYLALIILIILIIEIII